MRLLLINNSLVVNVIEAESIPVGNFGHEFAVFSDVGAIGDSYIDNELIPAPVIPIPAEPVVSVIPSQVSNIQAFAAIKYFGLLPSVNTYMNSLAADDLTRVTWEKATVFNRSSPTLTVIAEELELTEVQLDAMFAYAATVQV